MSHTVHDIVIIGSGPAGYTAAIYAARAGLTPVVIAGSVTAGGSLMNTTEVENFPGFPQGIMGPVLMDQMREQAQNFGAQIVWDDVEHVSLEGSVKSLTTGSGDVYQARAVIVATGSEYRRLGLPQEDKLSGRGVSFCATCDGFFFKDQHVVVVGGGDSAMEEASFLTRFASRVTIVHRRDAFRASQIMQTRVLENPKISVLWNSAVAEIHGEKSVESLTIENTVTGDRSPLEATGVFVAIGHVPRTNLFADLLDRDVNGYILCQGRSSKTNLAGVFACGDAVDHTYRQAITAAGSGCSAALDTQAYLTELDD